MSISISEWQQTLHKLNVEKGFYDYRKDIEQVEHLLTDEGRLHVSDQEALHRILGDYKQAMLERKLLLVIGELCEAHEELRTGHTPQEVYYTPAKPGKPEGFPIETADAHIRLLDLEAEAGLDAETNIAEKHGYNQTRPYKHGRTF